MLRWFNALLRPRPRLRLHIPLDRFHVPRRETPLPACRFRPYQDNDLPACLEIYRLNEAKHFPSGYIEEFTDHLRSRRSLYLICEVNGVIRGLGGIGSRPQNGVPIAVLSFGMIHPDFHNQGFGTALLLARLASFPAFHSEWLAALSTTGGSETFYRRFGFTFVETYRDEKNLSSDCYYTILWSDHGKECRNILKRSSIRLEISGAIVPQLC